MAKDLTSTNNDFGAVISIIENAKGRALKAVNAELNIIYPFREGNSRSIREFIRLMAKRMGYDLNWGNVDKEELLEASILSVDNYKVLITTLQKCVN